LYWSIVASILSAVIAGGILILVAGILIQVAVEFLKSRESQARKEAVSDTGLATDASPQEWFRRTEHGMLLALEVM
jgi:hypothetical protein